ncbi:MAG: DoxX family protein [Chitinophagia bacterium]|nr:DoxX family protein [Chitinophagia bacterium]
MSKWRNIMYWIATAWLSLGMVSTGIAQLTGLKTGAGGADALAHLGYPHYLLTIIGIAKLAGIVVVLLPGLRLLKEWTYAGFFFLMAGAIASHLAVGDNKGIFPGLLLLLLTLFSWHFRPPARRLVQPD